MQLNVLFSYSTQRGTILKKNVSLSPKSKSDTYWESKIHCISSLRYHLADVLKALKELESNWVRKKEW